MRSQPASSAAGLSSAAAARKLAADGFNELPSQKPKAWWHILSGVIREPMIFFLLAAGLIYLFLGEINDALILSSAIFVVIGITFYQERKTENALAALKNLASPRALVVRDGRQVRVPGREVVVGDILVLQEGDRVAADARLITASNLYVDESLLTGESLAVAKPVGKKGHTSVFSGTLVTKGRGTAEVISTGITTQMGKIGVSLATISDVPPRLRQETSRVIRVLGLLAGVVCLLVVMIYGLFSADWLTGLLSGLTLAMSLLPEELSVVLVIFLTLGAWRMSRHRVLARNTSAIETLGSATVLCVDKTGTITQNRMSLSALRVGPDLILLDPATTSLSEQFHTLLEIADLASLEDPFDQLETEIKSVASRHLIEPVHAHPGWKLAKEYPLSSGLLALSHVWSAPGSAKSLVAAKGAPEAIAELCHLSGDQSSALTTDIAALAGEGFRILGVARAEHAGDRLPGHQHQFNFQFVGLLGFADPVRPDISASLAECYRAGIRVIMLTGDYPGTACHIATRIGLANPDQYLTGDQVESMGVEELRKKITSINIFARLIPAQKLKIIEALKANGEIVAMTGDGVNDAPALKAAHIGVAMGERGTDVARESADLVLLDDDFSSIVSGVRQGRQIFDNLKKAIGYILAIHVPIAGLSLIPISLGLPAVFFPAHIAFLELIIDPACSVVFESSPPEPGLMARPPRKLSDTLISRPVWFMSLLQGFGLLFITLVVYFLTLSRTITFASLVLGNLMLIVSDYSWVGGLRAFFRPANKPLFTILILAAVVLGVIIYLPYFHDLFHFSPLSSAVDRLIPLVAAALSLLWFEVVELRRFRSTNF